MENIFLKPDRVILLLQVGGYFPWLASLLKMETTQGNAQEENHRLETYHFSILNFYTLI